MSQVLIFGNLEFAVINSSINVKNFGGKIIMKLTKENAKIIKVGEVVKFTYPNKTSNTGVVYGHPSQGDWGILYRTRDGSCFGHGTSMFTGEIDFEILQEHDPVVFNGLEYEFVKQ